MPSRHLVTPSWLKLSRRHVYSVTSSLASEEKFLSNVGAVRFSFSGSSSSHMISMYITYPLSSIEQMNFVLEDWGTSLSDLSIKFSFRTCSVVMDASGSGCGCGLGLVFLRLPSSSCPMARSSNNAQDSSALQSRSLPSATWPMIMDSGDLYHITYRKDYLVDFKEYGGGNILLGDGRECRVQGTCKVPVQTRDGSNFVLNNVRSTQQCTKSGIAKHLGVLGIQQQNKLVKETNVTLLAKVISKWKTGLKEEMDARLDVYVLNNGCKKSSDDKNDYYWEMHQSRVYNDKLVQTLLEGNSILSLKVVCTRLDIASASVDMLNEFDYGLHTDVHGFVNFDYAMGRSITRYGLMIQGCAVSWEAKFQHMWAFSTTEAEYVTLTETVKEATWLKGLSTESKTELKLVAVVATGAFIKADPWSEIPA
nr:zinc finger, CCHC-type [Tanacetum cinerariifolium]